MASERYSFAAVSEKAPLLGENKAGIHQKIEVKPMRYGEEPYQSNFACTAHSSVSYLADIPRSVDNVQKIMHDEAMMEYLIVSSCAATFDAPAESPSVRRFSPLTRLPSSRRGGS